MNATELKDPTVQAQSLQTKKATLRCGTGCGEWKSSTEPSAQRNSQMAAQRAAELRAADKWNNVSTAFKRGNVVGAASAMFARANSRRRQQNKPRKASLIKGSDAFMSLIARLQLRRGSLQPASSSCSSGDPGDPTVGAGKEQGGASVHSVPPDVENAGTPLPTDSSVTSSSPRDTVHRDGGWLRGVEQYRKQSLMATPTMQV